ncbi:uncharacterized protein LOC123307985 [Coccinella septempunctata]|uniref:uncharacterized protein LOC123307984 n=1 Tax=Coccinella septempunctata TaxID=41139 RepID=UPI001D07073A|nr:uncharacterized protein LOC123307984 [Coccinella septempunctata]XP_044746436.1 uncharacterized protein LOC123307985 [Coccinella septempunctata]
MYKEGTVKINPSRIVMQDVPWINVISSSNSELIIKFLEYVEDVNIFLGEFTALHIAVRRHLIFVVEYTIGRNAEINKKSSLSQFSALHEAVKYDTVDITRILLPECLQKLSYFSDSHEVMSDYLGKIQNLIKISLSRIQYWTSLAVKIWNKNS